MKKRIFGVLMVAALVASTPLLAQFGPQVPGFNGVWNPVVGSGATYEMTGKDKQAHQMTIAIVGRETVEGKDGYVMEIIMEQRGQVMVIQRLMVKDGDVMKTVRTVMQMGDKPPMDMTSMMSMMEGRTGSMASSADFRERNEHVGMESVTTPAGTFQADHWKNKDGSNDLWIAPGVPPWGMIKSVSKDTSVFMGPGRGQ
jgi:hypothetical protein